MSALLKISPIATGTNSSALAVTDERKIMGTEPTLREKIEQLRQKNLDLQCYNAQFIYPLEDGKLFKVLSKKEKQAFQEKQAKEELLIISEAELTRLEKKNQELTTESAACNQRLLEGRQQLERANDNDKGRSSCCPCASTAIGVFALVVAFLFRNTLRSYLPM